MELELRASDFSKLMFNIMDMPDNVDPVKHFPQLQKWEEFADPGKSNWTIAKKNKVFRYVVLMYDKKSPFREKVNDLIKRKIEIGLHVKLFTDPKKVPDDILEILEGKCERTNRMLIAYARMQRDSLYSLILGLEKQFYTDLLSIESGETVKRSITDTQAQLENKVIEFLNEDNTPKVKDSLFAYIEEERINNYRPEAMAAMLTKGEDPFQGKEMSYDTY